MKTRDITYLNEMQK